MTCRVCLCLPEIFPISRFLVRFISNSSISSRSRTSRQSRSVKIPVKVARRTCLNVQFARIVDSCENVSQKPFLADGAFRDEVHDEDLIRWSRVLRPIMFTSGRHEWPFTTRKETTLRGATFLARRLDEIARVLEPHEINARLATALEISFHIRQGWNFQCRLVSCTDTPPLRAAADKSRELLLAVMFVACKNLFTPVRAYHRDRVIRAILCRRFFHRRPTRSFYPRR